MDECKPLPGGGDGGQLARSNALNSEGLDGFPARVGELLKLGRVSHDVDSSTANPPRSPSPFHASDRFSRVTFCLSPVASTQLERFRPWNTCFTPNQYLKDAQANL